jgi:hypothetical protein
VFDTNPLRGDQAPLQFLVGSLFEYGTSSASNHQFQVMFDHSMGKYDEIWGSNLGFTPRFDGIKLGAETS